MKPLHRLAVVLALLTLLASAAQAQSPRFMTGSARPAPSGHYFAAVNAGVFWDRPEGYPEGDRWPLFLGKSGGPTSPDWPRFPGVEPTVAPDVSRELTRRLAAWRAGGRPLPSTVRIVLQHDAYDDTTIDVPIEIFGPGTHLWPARGVVEMMPRALEVTFHSAPGGARVFLKSPENGLLLGECGVPSLVFMPLFLGDDGRYVDRTVFFVRDGYLPRQEIVRPADLAEHLAFPADGVVTLQPASTWVVMRDALARPVVPIALLGVVVGGIVMRRRRRSPAVPSSAPVDTPARRCLGRWEIGERLGQGGSATVYRAHATDDPDREEVAIKILDEDAAEEHAECRRFEREVGISCRLSHASIVRIIDWDAQPPTPYLVMELLEGPTLRRMLADGPLAAETFVPFFRRLMDALRYAHEMGVVHRDIKPENVLTTGRGIPKIVDFGIARGTLFATVTTTGRTVGTMAYLPAERFVAAVTDEPRSDQYALGVMGYELLAGHRPWPDQALGEVLLGISKLRPPDLRRMRPEIPPGVIDVIERMMSVSMEARFEDMAAALNAFDAAAASDVKR